MEPVKLTAVPDSIHVEIDGDDATDHVVLEIVPAELMFEELTLKAGGKTDVLLSSIQEWFKTEYQKEITKTMAWDLLLAVRAGFAAHKKKLEPTLRSVIGTGSIPSNGNDKTENSESSEQNSTNESLVDSLLKGNY